MQMDLGLPGEAHAAVDLETVAGAAHGGLVGEDPGRRDIGRVGRDGGRVHRGAGRLRPDQDPRAQVRNRLEGPDGSTELFARPGVLRRELADAAAVRVARRR